MATAAHLLAPSGFAIVGPFREVLSEMEHFITGVRPTAAEPGVVATILQCDIEGSTAFADELKDQRWADLLAHYGRLADRAVVAQGGRVVDQIGDGLMASFPGPVAAIRSARRLQYEANELGIRVRAGVHMGEVVPVGNALRGIAVHLAARAMAQAKGGEVVVTETVRDIVAGSGLRFADRGLHELKGIAEPRRLYAVTDPL